MSRPLRRRTFLRLATVAVAGVVSGPYWETAAQAAGEEPSVGLPFVAGTIASKARSSLDLLPHAGSRVRVECDTGCRMYSGVYGRTDSAAEMLVGDEVVALGTWDGDVFRANSVGSVFRPVGALTVTAVLGHNVGSTAGPLDISAMNLPDVGDKGPIHSGDLKVGTRLAATVWTHPETSVQYLVAASRAAS